MAELNITKRRVDGIVVLDLAGDICLGDQNLLLKQTLRSLIEQNETKILLNLAGVSKIDSSGLGELVSGYATVSKAGGTLKLMNLSDRVTELMNLTKLLTVFDIYEDEAVAVASFPLSASDLRTVQIDKSTVTIKAIG
jgi:anti-sigma B factor antagonist